MEKEMELSTERPSLLILNEYCLLEIFALLQLDDFMNLAECCNRLRRVADRAVKIKSKFELNKNMFRKRRKYIDRVFTHIGHNVSWLRIDCGGNKPNLSSNFSKFISDCNNLKSLQIFDLRGECRFESTLHNFDKIKMLALRNCDLGMSKIFLGNFYKLKFLTIHGCRSDEELMTALLNNNPELESFCFFVSVSSDNFRILRLLEQIPKVKRLGLEICHTLNTRELNPLLTLNGLTKLRLDCFINNINNVLSELARKGMMEEMELNHIEIDDNFFDILKSFVRLYLLVIRHNNSVKVKPSTIWPTNLKLLRLGVIEFTHLSFVSTIQQLKSLEYMDIQECAIAERNIMWENVATLSRNILSVMDHGNRKQRLEVVLPHFLFRGWIGGPDSKIRLLVDSKPLRILRGDLNPEIGIHFPGLAFNP